MDLAQVFLVGELLTDPKEIKYEKNSYYTDIKIRVARPFKNTVGEMVFDTYTISFWKGAGMDLKVGAQIGSSVCVSGRLETRKEIINDIAVYHPVIIAEKCSFKV